MLKILTIGSLGHKGRFGNQLFQVCTGIGLARRLGAELQIPADWPGRKIFKVEIPPIRELPKAQTKLDYLPDSADMERYGCIDMSGFWQYQEAMDMYSREDILKWLPFQDWVLERFSNILPGIVIHKRRGDYLAPQNIGRFCTIADQSFHKCLYEQALAEYEHSQPVNVVEISDNYSRHDEYCDSAGLSFLPDFMQMVNANLVIRSNSTFSFWAPILGRNNVYSPVVEDKVGWNEVVFLKGNHPRIVDNKNFPQHKLTDLHLRETMSAG